MALQTISTAPLPFLDVAGIRNNSEQHLDRVLVPTKGKLEGPTLTLPNEGLKPVVTVGAFVTVVPLGGAG